MQDYKHKQFGEYETWIPRKPMHFQRWRENVKLYPFFSAHESASAVTSKPIDNVDEVDDGAEETSGSEESEEVLVANGESITQLR